MLSTDTKKTAIFRNYLIIMGTLATLITGLGGLFENPDRLGQQDRLDNYGRFVSGVVVNQARRIRR
ncbi:hypothetical protein [Crocosphaera sp. Alani8]|uniref:hypothetical protein n=1 Tax=Crocosphaera sp. Alani8 TaxID=3038952 RepID=UPI00313EBC8F